MSVLVNKDSKIPSNGVPAPIWFFPKKGGTTQRAPSPMEKAPAGWSSLTLDLEKA